MKCSQTLFVPWLPVLMVVMLAAQSCLLAGEEVDASRTFSMDVVELQRGNSLPGNEDFQLDWKGYRYRFANPENLELFQESPEDYEVQLDGGCGRMGSLSGRGRTDLFALYKKRLYVFASKQCRTTFLASPEDFLEQDDVSPTFSDDDRRRGVRLLDEVIAAHGGAKRIDSIRSYTRSFEEQVTAGGEEYLHQSTMRIDYSGRIMEKVDQWNDQKYVSRLDPDRSEFQSGDETRPMYAAAKREMQRAANHELLSILKARSRSDFKVFAHAAKLVEGRQEDRRLFVFFDGTQVELLIDPRTYRVLSVTFRGRGPRLTYGTKTVVLSDLQEFSSALLPTRQDVEFEGKIVEDASRSFSVRVNN